MAEEKIVLSFKEYLSRQREEAFGEYNKYFFWKMFGYSPNDSEAFLYYVDSGGSENFAKRHVPAEAILSNEKTI